MKVVYKYPVEVGYFECQMPVGAQILTMQVQRDSLQMWALVDPGLESIMRRFLFTGTGHYIERGDNLSYISTIQRQDGEFIFHLFEVLG